jgi:hypothetical protein
MRLPRVRFTVRRMMIAVAILCVPLCGVQIASRRDWYLRNAASAAKDARYFAREADQSQERLEYRRWRDSIMPTDVPFTMTPAAYAESIRNWELEIEENRAKAAYWESLRLKYENAARYPWLPVEPDLPEPE